MGSSDQPIERAAGTEQDIVDDYFRWGYRAVAVVPGHFHQREDLRDPADDLVVAAERSDDAGPPFLEPFGAADWHPEDHAPGTERTFGPAFVNVTRGRDARRAWHRLGVTYFRDLSPYTDTQRERVLAVGWLAVGEPFATGAFPDDLLACLLCRQSEVMTMGSHRCELCLPSANEDFLSEESQRVASGSHEHLIDGEGGITYAAPELIYHYIREHGYAPPEQFTAALRATCARRSAAEVRIATRRYAYESAVQAFDNDLDELGVAFTHPSDRAQDLIFCDLRAKTKFGRLHQVEDMATVLLHRAPSLSSDEARDAAAEVWTAWNRFLSHEEFEADWLQLEGPPRYLETTR